jgi:hypothetical protein
MKRSLPPRTTLLALLLPVAACNGSIGAPGAPPTGSGSGGGNNPALATDPGRVTVHRLNRVEYNNTVRDLLGTAQAPANDFPTDDRGYGFDNVADVLSLSPIQLQLYESAADGLITEALAGAQRARIVSCDVATGDACVRTVLKNFARRAWRRPVADAEVDRLMTIVSLVRTNGDGIDVALPLALQAVLVSPNFLFRVELDADPTSLKPHLLTSHEIAARLSYFLWSTMPDDELSAAADAGMLTDKAQLEAQVTRMLKSPKAAALVDNFAGQWLYTRQVDEVQPDPKAFPMFDADLRAAMKQEATRMFSDVLFGGLSAQKLLMSDYTYVNDRLAKHYGLPAVGSTAMQKVTLPADGPRGGFLMQGAFLSVTSHPTRTSPVVRGKWVLNQLLCQDVPPPPANVVATLDSAADASLSVRQRLEAHKQNPCASCHNIMDPIGFGLENYDAVGAYRTMDGAYPVDSSGALPDGRAFNGARQLSNIVVADPGFARCITEKLYTYALGRAPVSTAGHMDTAVLPALTKSFHDGGYPMAGLIAGIVTSDTFMKRRGEPGGGP